MSTDTGTNSPADPPVGQNPQRSPWMYVGCGCLTLLVAGSGCVMAIVFGVFSILKNTEPATHAVELAQDSPAVKMAIGEPISMGWMVQGNVQIENQTGEANIQVPVSGPAGSGVVHLEATRQNGVWRYQKATFTADSGGPEINLLEGADAPPPAFKPDANEEKPQPDNEAAPAGGSEPSTEPSSDQS